MTTFQDPPPQSRRAVRQSERGESADASVRPEFVSPQPAPFADQPQREMWDTTARRVAQLPTSAARHETGEQPPAGRRAASPNPEPLTYSTVQRPQVPTYDGPFRNTPPASAPASDTPTNDALPPTQALPRADQPTYRVRDYSPEARPAAAAWTAATTPAPAAPPSDLEYHTEARRLTAVPPLPPEPTPAPVSAVPAAPITPAAVPPAQPESAAPTSPPETTLSRRELRAMLLAESTPFTPPAPLVEPAPWKPQAAEPAAETLALPTAQAPSAPQSVETSTDAPQAWPFAFGEAAAPAPAPAAPSVPQEAVPQQAAPQRIVPQQDEQGTPQAPVAESGTPIEDGARSLFGDIMTPISAPLTVSPDLPERSFESGSWSVGRTEVPGSAASSPALPPVAPEPLTNTALTNAMQEFDALTTGSSTPAVPPAPVSAASVAPAMVEPAAVEPAASSPASVSTESAWSPPVGHWSRQRDLEDETQPFENTISRRIGSGSTTTNALVLPTPDRDIRGALTGTGEVMLTGSIDLPSTLSSTGASDRVEHHSLDMLFDANDHEIVATDSAPVRAIRAVSTHNTGHGVTHTQKPKGNKSLTVLFVVAGGLALLCVGMVVTLIITNF